MTENPDVKHCANPSCNAHFSRLGQGKLYVFHVDDPKAWGLPGHVRQKAVWLCRKCENQLYIRLDRVHHRVNVAHKPAAHHHQVA